jgi:hypothetical protein
MFDWDHPENLRFMNKHVVVVGNNASLADMIAYGSRVFEGRVRAASSSKSKAVKQLKETYGAGFKRSLANTLLVLTPNAKEQLRAAFNDANCANKQYEIKCGLFFMSYDGRTEIGLTAKLGVKFLANTIAPEGKHLDHLNTPTEPNPTVIATTVANMADQAFLAQRIVSHSSTPEATHLVPAAPTSGALLAAKSKLKHVETRSTGSIPTWALSDYTGVDLSFLDDDF